MTIKLHVPETSMALVLVLFAGLVVNCSSPDVSRFANGNVEISPNPTPESHLKETGNSGDGSGQLPTPDPLSPTPQEQIIPGLEATLAASPTFTPTPTKPTAEPGETPHPNPEHFSPIYSEKELQYTVPREDTPIRLELKLSNEASEQPNLLMTVRNISNQFLQIGGGIGKREFYFVILEQTRGMRWSSLGRITAFKSIRLNWAIPPGGQKTFESSWEREVFDDSPDGYRPAPEGEYAVIGVLRGEGIWAAETSENARKQFLADSPTWNGPWRTLVRRITIGKS